MRPKVKVALVFTLIVVFIGAFGWVRYLEWSALKHDTERWCVIEDVNGDRIAVETNDDKVWAQLVELHQNKSRMWVGGIVERYDNRWGFRFNPDTITIAEVTAEGLQATIKYISSNLNYWLGNWAYVGAKVVEVHQP